MKIQAEPRDDHQVTLTVELEQEQLESAKRHAARRISERKSIPGFRPGKAPYEVVLRSFGEAIITEDAVDLLLNEVYPKALDEAKLEPGASGSLEKVEGLDKNPRFVFIVPLAPKVDLGIYRSIRIPYDWKEPGESKVEESIEELRQMYAKTETVARPIQKGDFVMIDLKGVKAKATEGDAPLLDRPSLPVFIRPDEKAEEFPFPGFSNKLIGMSANESKTFSHKYMNDVKEETLQGQNVQFAVTVKMVRGSILPELNDDFAKQAGPFENLQVLREAVKANLASQSKAQYDDDYFNRLIEKIKEGAVIKYPPQMVDHEVEHVMEDLKSRLVGQNLDMAAYLKSRQMDETKFVAEEARPIAVKRLERSLIMEEIAKAEKIEVSNEMLQSSFQQTLDEVQGDSNFQKITRGKSQAPKQLMNAVAMESANRAFVRQVLNRLKEIATGQAPELSEEGITTQGTSRKPISRKKTVGDKKPASRKTNSTTKKLPREEKTSEGTDTIVSS